MTATETRLELVLACARRGWRVFPVHYPVEDEHGNLYCSCERSDCTSVAKHPLGRLVHHGFEDASADEGVIRAWYAAEPSCSWAVATGAVSGVIVLDVDPRHGGDESLRDLEVQFGRLPDTLIAHTGGGGEHYWFAHPGGRIPDSVGMLGPGLDVRGDGGYVVVPPSMHAQRRSYRWDAAIEDIETAVLASLPAWMLPRVESEHAYTVSGASVAPEEIPEGQRDNTLTSLAGSMRYRGLSAEEMLPSLLAVNVARCRPPLPESDIRRIAWSIGQKPAGELRDGVPLETAAAARPATGIRPFPLDALPGAVRDFASAWAKALHSIPEMVALPCLVYASAAIGNTRSIRITSRYIESALLWGAIIGDPGSRKSPAIREAGRWLRQRDVELYETYKRDVDDYNWRLSQLKKGELRPDPPMRKHRVVQDSTIEALAKILSEDGRGLAMDHDELGAWIGSFDQYRAKGAGADRARWLSIWTGSEIRVDRIREGGSFVIAQPFVSVCGPIQPDFLKTLTSEIGNDGFLARFVFVYIPHLPAVGIDEPDIDEAIIQRWNAVIDDLLSNEMAVLVSMRPDGAAAFRAGSARWAQTANDPDLDPRLLGFYAKGDTIAARLALILHCIRDASGEVDEPAVDADTASSAWRLMDYFASTMQYVAGRIAETETDQTVSAIVNYCNTHGGRLTAHDAQRKGVASIKGAEEMLAAFKQVQNYGLARLERETVSGGHTRWTLITRESPPLAPDNESMKNSGAE